ncbi:hypothetical protein ACFVR1_03425 [Psychrobacillus sp. NPDC058041]|uniref:hypothetical protein n=1 Tax=Psychrobacillus sp. NPDC058041 TaxID=3346310 RepID=UPI0036D9B6B6
MTIIKNELAEWLTSLCGTDKECEQDIRLFLRQDKTVIKEIKIEFEKGNIQFVQRIITKYLSESNKIIRTCKACDKKHFISIDELEGMKCKKCNETLLKRAIVEGNSKKTKDSVRKCLYCSNPVSPLENAITCFYHRDVSFSLYE